jgi:hypothetical protein
MQNFYKVSQLDDGLGAEQGTQAMIRAYQWGFAYSKSRGGASRRLYFWGLNLKLLKIYQTLASMLWYNARLIP